MALRRRISTFDSGEEKAATYVRSFRIWQITELRDITVPPDSPIESLVHQRPSTGKIHT
jgi:hypothetical protein